MSPGRPRLLVMTAIAALTVAAGPVRAQQTPGDPWERTNRRFFAIEESLDRHLFGPVSSGYGKSPGFFRDALRNFCHNLNEPTILVNDLLQVRPVQAAKTLTRFVLNSTIGIAGIVDVAKQNHLRYRENGFGNTLGRWGVGPGPYIFLPLVGPTTLRDGFGSLADIGLNPLNYIKYPDRDEIGIAITIAGGLSDRTDAQQDIQTIRQTSTDPYATLRSYYLQKRAAEIAGKPVSIDALPDLDTPETSPSPPTPSPPPPPSGGASSPQTQAEADPPAPTPTAAPAALPASEDPIF
ncbi:VacJ family lipoprotein [Phenylobacterium sp.]|uniref:MlaA family lipoprotein n=1 Tax=Phenylobacterium sp. TaxID=1871053 RepID=UPI001208E487|nr:VacJ family lipoprotein [Phenylobacterium sp.]THD61321.1 MAG: VacJ family lipoprotein [Phenylobacterium sp.]